MHVPAQSLLCNDLGISHLRGAPALSSQTASTDVLPDLSSWQPHVPVAQAKISGIMLTLLFLPHPTSIEIV